MPSPPKAAGRPPDHANDPWRQRVQEDIQKAPERLEETAKFLVGIISISLTIFLSDRPEGLAPWTAGWFVAATVWWLLSALLGFFVLFPWRYRFHEDSPEDIQRAYGRITRTKRRLLLGSLACFFVALGVGAYALLFGMGEG